MRTGPTRVGILEDQQLFRESLVTLLRSEGLEVVAQSSESADFLAQVARTAPDVVLVDVWLERLDSDVVEDGLRVVEVLRELHPNTRALVLSGDRDMALVERSFRSGAAGYLCKLNVSCAEVLAAVERVAHGEWLVPPELVGPVRPSHTDERTQLRERLTQREREVLGHVAAGSDNLRIAACLNITERTVKAHISSIYRKLAVQNRVEMAMLACQLGLAQPPPPPLVLSS